MNWEVFIEDASNRPASKISKQLITTRRFYIKSCNKLSLHTTTPTARICKAILDSSIIPTSSELRLCFHHRNFSLSLYVDVGVGELVVAAGVSEGEGDGVSDGDGDGVSVGEPVGAAAVGELVGALVVAGALVGEGAVLGAGAEV
jgi:hypothetical protein